MSVVAALISRGDAASREGAAGGADVPPIDATCGSPLQSAGSTGDEFMVRALPGAGTGLDRRGAAAEAMSISSADALDRSGLNDHWPLRIRTCRVTAGPEEIEASCRETGDPPQ